MLCKIDDNLTSMSDREISSVKRIDVFLDVRDRSVEEGRGFTVSRKGREEEEES